MTQFGAAIRKSTAAAASRKGMGMNPSPGTGDPVEDIETAKRLVARQSDKDLPGLMATVADRAAPHSARIAATWCLGFVDASGASRMVLAEIAENPDEPPHLRDHAAEAPASVLPA